MAKWKLCRQTYSDDTYEFTEGDEVTIGRGTQNTIILQSLNISRKHCVITVKKDEVIIEDLKSANGIFVGLKKIAPNVPFSLSNNDVIGLGWTDGAPLARVNDAEQFVFKLLKVSNDQPSIANRILFQNEPMDIPPETISHSINASLTKIFGPSSKLSLKRKSNTGVGNKDEIITKDATEENEAHSSFENKNKMTAKKYKCSSDHGEVKDECAIKIEKEDNDEYEAFSIKQEFLDDEVQIIDSDSDSEQWYIRLSLNSPRKSFNSYNDNRKSEDVHQDSSYSQLEDDVISLYDKADSKIKNDSDDEQFEADLITILPPPTDTCQDAKHYKFIEPKNDFASIVLDTIPKLKSIETVENAKELDHSYSTPPQPDNIGDKKAEKISELDKINKNNEKTTLRVTNDNHNFIDKEIKHMPAKSESASIGPYKFSSDTTGQSGNSENIKKTQFTDCKSHSRRKSSHSSKGKIKKKSHSKLKQTSKIQITNSQKEERKKKLREIAAKDKVEGSLCSTTNKKYEECSTSTSKVNAKVTALNRGAFLIDSNSSISNAPIKKKTGPENKGIKSDNKALPEINNCIKEQDKISTNTEIVALNDANKKLTNKTEKNREKRKKRRSRRSKNRTSSADATRSAAVSDTAFNRRHSETIIKDSRDKKSSPVSNEKENELMMSNQIEKPSSITSAFDRKEESFDKYSVNAGNNLIKDSRSSEQKDTSGDAKLKYKIQIPIQKVNPIMKSSIKTILRPMKENKEPNTQSKRVRFSDVQPEVRVFEIEQGNQMKKTSSVKSTLLATRNDMPIFSLQKIALMKILRWNPQWLEEQNNFSEPPPILGHNHVPIAILHSFSSHAQYVELIGDLLLMEIWECLTQGYVRTRNQNNYLQMRIESLPLVPPQRRAQELINLNVNVSLPTAKTHSIPREGEIMMFHLGDDIQICRFFFVHNVRCLPSPPNNINSFYSISLQTLFTEKIRTLQRGAVVYGRVLAYVNKDLRLFDVLQCLSTSPLSDVILNPQPQDFTLDDADTACNLESQWTKSLNDSQRKAVMCAVSAARGERPRIHMIQGPPGTGKSRVICAIVMEYFYDAGGRRRAGRGKLLLCATSNAAVDELVVRLLDIRQSLPQPERLRVVRVGRDEAMAARARDISLQKLAQRDAARLQPEPAPHAAALSAEISLLEAKKNMWLSKATSAGDDARVVYCQNRVAEITKKIALFRSSGGGGAACGPEQLAQAERRVLERADVVLTTLASAHSHKMRGLAGRIALCVVDEAGQAIEPESLVPLALGVTRLALVGDPQQLPGYICSQRAKKHGLGESLFARLASCAEAWPGAGPLLLDRQYRMHPHIAAYPNRAFYGGRVRDEPPAPPALPAPPLPPYTVLAVDSGCNGQDVSGANEAEAWAAARVALALRARLRGASPAAPSLAVITPYVAQRDLVRRHVRTLLQVEGGEAGGQGAAAGGGGEEGEVEVNTVDSFQGQERGAVVVSLARSRGPGFLAAAGRVNVLLTRARHALVLCLNPRALQNNDQWRSLVEDAQRRNLYSELPPHMCQHPSIQNVSNEDILQYLSPKPPVNNTRNPPYQAPRPGQNYRRRHNYVRN